MFYSFHSLICGKPCSVISGPYAADIGIVLLGEYGIKISMFIVSHIIVEDGALFYFVMFDGFQLFPLSVFKLNITSVHIELQ